MQDDHVYRKTELVGSSAGIASRIPRSTLFPIFVPRRASVLERRQQNQGQDGDEQPGANGQKWECRPSIPGLVKLIEDTAICEVFGLRPRPSSETLLNREDGKLWESREILGRRVLGGIRPKEMPCGE